MCVCLYACILGTFCAVLLQEGLYKNIQCLTCTGYLCSQNTSFCFSFSFIHWYVFVHHHIFHDFFPPPPWMPWTLMNSYFRLNLMDNIVWGTVNVASLVCIGWNCLGLICWHLCWLYGYSVAQTAVSGSVNCPVNFFPPKVITLFIPFLTTFPLMFPFNFALGSNNTGTIFGEKKKTEENKVDGVSFDSSNAYTLWNFSCKHGAIFSLLNILLWLHTPTSHCLFKFGWILSHGKG